MRADVMLPYRTPATAEPKADIFIEGAIQGVTAAGATFTVPGWDGGKHVFGPAPWPMSRVQPGSDGDAAHDHPETVPAEGARCLVLFLGGGIERPWILGVWPA